VVGNKRKKEAKPNDAGILLVQLLRFIVFQPKLYFSAKLDVKYSIFNIIPTDVEYVHKNCSKVVLRLFIQNPAYRVVIFYKIMTKLVMDFEIKYKFHFFVDLIETFFILWVHYNSNELLANDQVLDEDDDEDDNTENNETMKKPVKKQEKSRITFTVESTTIMEAVFLILTHHESPIQSLQIHSLFFFIIPHQHKTIHQIPLPLHQTKRTPHLRNSPNLFFPPSFQNPLHPHRNGHDVHPNTKQSPPTQHGKHNDAARKTNLPLPNPRHGLSQRTWQKRRNPHNPGPNQRPNQNPTRTTQKQNQRPLAKQQLQRQTEPQHTQPLLQHPALLQLHPHNQHEQTLRHQKKTNPHQPTFPATEKRNCPNPIYTHGRNDKFRFFLCPKPNQHQPT